MKHVIFFLLIGSALFHSCNICEFMGAHELGNDLVLLEGDRLEDRIIVRCTNRKGSGCCYGGQYVLPSYEEHMYKGRYNEYIEAAKSNGQWIVAKSVRLLDEEKPQQYWIIDKGFNLDGVNCLEVDCDSIVQSYVTGPLEHEDFLEQLERLKIDLKID